MEKLYEEFDKGTIRETSLDFLLDQIEVFTTCRAKTIYHITEVFGKYMSTYKLVNLIGDIDLDMVTFSDDKGELLKEIKPLSFFMTSLVEGISYLWDKSISTYIATIVFADGNITIKTDLNEVN